MGTCQSCGAETEQTLCEECAIEIAADLRAEESHPDAKEQRKFLQQCIDYLQDRLEFVNNKANIFIAIQTGLFVTIVWLLGSFFLPNGQQGLSPRILGVILFLAINFGFVILVIGLLLQTVRPSKSYLSLYTGIDTVDTSNVMWPGSDLPDPKTFVARVDSLSDQDMERELVGTVYTLHQLANRTYSTYRWAVLLMKIQIVVVPLGFLLLVVLKYVSVG